MRIQEELGRSSGTEMATIENETEYSEKNCFKNCFMMWFGNNKC
jgi:hypothetical protein